MRALIALLLAATCGCAAGSTGPVGAGPVSTGRAPGVVDVGETVDHTMHTHCGVESTQINGRVWNAVEPLYSSPDRLGPPRGWGNPEQDGTLTLQSADRAVFAALGEQVVLTPSASNEPLRPCD